MSTYLTHTVMASAVVELGKTFDHYASDFGRGCVVVNRLQTGLDILYGIPLGLDRRGRLG